MLFNKSTINRRFAAVLQQVAQEVRQKLKACNETCPKSLQKLN